MIIIIKIVCSRSVKAFIDLEITFVQRDNVKFINLLHKI